MKITVRSQYCFAAFLFLTGFLSALPIFAAPRQENNGLSRDPAELKSLKYRAIGPAWGGRVSRACGVPGNPAVFYAATASGGVWKSEDGGYSWKSIFDNQPISSIGSIAVALSDANVIYVGSGEANIRGNVAAGNGIYKSTDAGKTWSHVWKQEGQIGTMVVHPANSEIAFAAVLGHAFGPNPERGVYRTTNGGKTWEQVLKKDETTGASDVAIDNNNPNILFAGLGQTRRFPWDLQSGGPGSGLYVSRDGGSTWKQLTGKGLPDGIWGKVGVAIAPSDSRLVYALIEAEQGGLFLSQNGGESWERISASRQLRQRAWYYSTLTVHPTNPNEIWFPSVPMLKTIDGGKTIRIVKGFHHGDHHDLWIDPKNPKRMINANDGGIDISVDGGETWYAPALPIGQFYHVSVDSRVPFHVAGAMQDIGTAQGPSNSLSSRGIRTADWNGVGGGEAGHVVSDWLDPNIVYAGEYGGYISRYDHRTRQARHVGIYPEDPSGHGGEDLKYRFQWTAPILVSPHDSKTVYHAGNVLFKTMDGGQTWKPISPDLTRNDKSKQKWAGGPITGDNTGVEIYCTIFAVAESPRQKDLLWAGTDDGLVHITRDGGKNWKNVTGGMKDFPEWGTVSMIEASKTDAGTAYVVVDAHRLDNTKPYLYKTTNFGATWTRLDKDLPGDVYLHVVREDPVIKDLLYLGTERGVSISTDAGSTWKSLQLNLPTVAVHDLVVKGNSLVVGTHGRSIWIFDHLSVIREWNQQVKNSDAHLFSISDAIRWRFHGGVADKWTGANPMGRAVFYYYLKEAPKGDISIDILDSDNNVVKSLSSIAREAIGYTDDPAGEAETFKKEALTKEVGVNAVAWSLSYNGSELIENGKIDLGNSVNGSLAPPGQYTVRLTVNEKSFTRKLQILPDPRLQVSDADLRAQHTFSLTVRDEISRLVRMVRQIRAIRQQLVNRNELIKSDAKAVSLLKDSEALIKKLDQIEGELHNPNAEIVYDILAKKGGAKLYSRMPALFDWATESDGAPTQGMREVFAAQKAELDKIEAVFRQVLNQSLPALNDQAKKLDVPHILVK